MRTAEESSGTVLHRLIQEQLRYGNPTDTRTLLAIQQQALRGGSSSSSGDSSSSSSSGSGSGRGGGTGSPLSSLESLTQEETQYIQMSTRQEPQGQEHQGDFKHLETACDSPASACHLYQLHGEELPTYEEAKAHSLYLASRRGMPQLLQGPPPPPPPPCGDDAVSREADSESMQQWEMKREHARSLSERLMRLSLERNGGPRAQEEEVASCMSSSHSYPQLSYQGQAGPGESPYRQQPAVEPRGPPPDYPFPVPAPGYMVSHSQEHEHYYDERPPPFHSQHHHRYVPQQNQVPLHHPQQLQLHDLYPTASLPGAGAGAGAGGAGAGAGGLMAFIPGSSSQSSGHGSGHSSPAQMDLLMKENEMLRRELEGYNEKAARLQKLELEIQRISEAYETLMKGSAKRETLEKTMRNKLEAEIKRMHDFNRDLRERLDTATKRRVAEEVESTDQKQHIFAKLLEQNEEQQRERERLERELQCLRSSGEERLLALGSAQARNRQLEEELRRKRAYVEKVERLQSSLAQLQAACEKRENLELRLRTRLEQELKNLRAQQWQSRAASDPSEPCFPNVQQQQLREREERILALEADITKWEQKYLEESTMRQFAMDAAATAAAQRDTTIINHSPGHSPNNSFNDHLPLSNYKHQEMENRIRALHAQLLEKDAVIKVLHQRSKREQQGLRPARSVPSIATTTTGPCDHSSSRGKVKSLSDDQTATVSAVTTTSTSTAAVALLPPLPRGGRVPTKKAPSRDCSTQCDGSLEEPAITPSALAPSLDGSIPISENGEPLKDSHASNVLKDMDTSDSELVEILI